MAHTKLKSTTFWLTLSIVVLNPIAWFVDYMLRKDLISYIVEQGIDPDNINAIQNLVVQIPLGTIATAMVTALTAFIAGNKARNISTNLTLPVGQDGRQEQ